MKKTIARKEYDTQNASVVRNYVSGYFGDPAGYEEILYQTPDGFFFLYVCGGELSPYPSEDILRLGKEKANDWLNSH